MIDLRGLFTKDAIVRHLKALPTLQTPVMDGYYTDRPQSGLPIIGIEEILATVQALPVVRRGAPSIAATDETRNYTFIEPLPIHPHISVTAADLNNLKVLDNTGRDAWVRGKIDYLRRVCRMTTEAIAGQSITGTISWPVKLAAGGWESYTIDYGSVINVTPDKLWDAADAKLADVFALLTAMQEELQKNGYGGDVLIWAGKSAYLSLFKVAENSKTTARIRVEITDQGINVGGFLVRRRAEQYRNPETKTFSPVVADKDVKMLARDAGAKLIYAAVDDLDANLQPMPFFTKPVKKENPSGYDIIGQSKPLPVPNVKGIAGATVVS